MLPGYVANTLLLVLLVSLGAVMVIYGVGDLALCLKNHVHTTGKVTVDQVAGL